MRYSLDLKSARRRRGITQAELAEAVGVEQPTVQRWESGKRTPDTGQLLMLAEALGVEPGELFDGSSIVPLGPRLFVKGEVAAGVWREAWEIEADEWEAFTGRADIEAPMRTRFGLRVVGDSMDLLYPHGSIVECVFVDSGEKLESGRRVVVERVRHSQERETTVKEYQVDREGREWLVPRSSNPAFQTPIQISVEDPEIEVVRIIAIVVGSYRSE
jgi:transcriptional regulator with XRE-family HTH domain